MNNVMQRFAKPYIMQELFYTELEAFERWTFYRRINNLCCIYTFRSVVITQKRSLFQRTLDCLHTPRLFPCEHCFLRTFLFPQNNLIYANIFIIMFLTKQMHRLKMLDLYWIYIIIIIIIYQTYIAPFSYTCSKALYNDIN